MKQIIKNTMMKQIIETNNQKHCDETNNQKHCDETNNQKHCDETNQRPVDIYASKKRLMKFFIIPVISFEPCLILGKEIDCLPS